MAVINWQTDPIYFDFEPTQVNDWVNANELLEQNKREEIFQIDNLLKLYPIMVRRNDFVRKKSTDRIIARFPFIILEEDQKEFIRENILNLSEITRNYFYKAINKSIMEWKKIIENYLKKGTIPYPIYRCSFELDHTKSTHCNTKSLLHFTSARGEPFTMPTKLSKKLAYLCGMCNGDGNLTKYILRIVDYSIQNIKQLQVMFKEYFAQTGNILYKTENCPELVITNLWVVRLFSFLTDQPIGGKKYHALREPLIFQDDPIFRSYYWSGVMDSDGSYKQRNVKFVSVSLNYVKDFQAYLLDNKIDSKLTERNDNTVTLYIPARFHLRLIKLLTCLHPEKKYEFADLKTIPYRSESFFAGFKKTSLINNYFNLRLIDNLGITGLGQIIHQIRGKQARRTFVEKLPISEKALQYIEKEKMSINVLLLDDILKQVNIQLMRFLSSQDSNLYRIRSSEHVKLPTQPSESLSLLLKPLIFYKQLVKIPEENKELVQKLENYFQVSIKDYKISNKLLLQFFSIYCETKLIKN